MKRRLLVFAASVQILSSEGATHGPICQWHEDPCTTMAVHWIESESEVGGGWESSAGPFVRSEQGWVVLRRAIVLPADLAGKAVLAVAGTKGSSTEVYLDGTQVGTSSPGGAVVEFPVPAGAAGSRVLLGILLRGAPEASGNEVPGPRVTLRHEGKDLRLCDRATVWNHCRALPPEPRWNQVPPLEELLNPERAFLFAYRKVGDSRWSSVSPSSRPFGTTTHKVHSVDLKNLSPDSRYGFMILRRGQVVGRWFFETAPATFTEGMSFVTGGDMFHTREMLDGMNRRAGTEGPLFALLGGDLAYANGVDGNRWLEWIESWAECAISPEGNMIPMIPVIGNHEVRGAAYRPTSAPPRSEAPFFYSLFHGMEEGSKFTVDFGDYMTVIALDSGHTQNVAPQTPWLRETLGERKIFPFKFVCYHRPAWGTGVKGDAVEIQRAWCPLFEEHGVDAVFENDHHTYKRTHPLTAGKRDDAGGVVYIGDGAWGTRTRGIGSGIKRKRPFLAHAESTNHLIKVVLGKEQIVYEAITAVGRRIDVSQRKPRR